MKRFFLWIGAALSFLAALFIMYQSSRNKKRIARAEKDQRDYNLMKRGEQFKEYKAQLEDLEMQAKDKIVQLEGEKKRIDDNLKQKAKKIEEMDAKALSNYINRKLSS